MIPGKSARGCSARGVQTVSTNMGSQAGGGLEPGLKRGWQGVWVDGTALRVAEGRVVRTAVVDDGGREVGSLVGAGVGGLQPASKIATSRSKERPPR